MNEPLIPQELIYQQERIAKLKVLLGRLENGSRMMQALIDERNYAKFDVYSKTYNEVMRASVDLMEQTQYFQEFLATGRSVLIRRNGSVKNMYPDGSKRPYDPKDLSALIKLSEIFGPDALEFVEFEDS